MLAPGHGPLSFPPVLAKARKDPAMGDRIVQAYEPKQYAAGGRYIVLGAGIASVNEWANILDAGASALALTRNPQPETQDLNVPALPVRVDRDRRLHAAAVRPADRVPRPGAARHAARAPRVARRGSSSGQKEGRFDAVIGEIDKVEPGPARVCACTSRARTARIPAGST